MQVNLNYTGIEYIEKLGLAQMDSIIELFNRSGAFLDVLYHKNKDKFSFVEKCFQILERI